MIIDAALSLARDGGLSAVSARSVANALGCSTGPIFHKFDTMDALQEALIDRIISDFVAAIQPDAGSDPLLVAGLQMVHFASSEPRLYEVLFLTHHPYHHKWGPVRKRIAGLMAPHPRYAQLSEAARFGLVGRASIIAHGLGVEVWSGRLPSPSPTTLQQLLMQLAEPLIEMAIQHGWTNDIHTSSTGRILP